MPTYIGLATWTQDGMKNIKDSPDRLEKAKQVYRNAGGEVKQFLRNPGWL